MTYPGASRVLFYTYGTAGGVLDQLNRPKEIRKTNGTGTILSDYQWSAAGRLALGAAISLACWLTALAAGRMIAYWAD